MSASIYYLDPLTPGRITSTKPSNVGQIIKQVISKINETDAIVSYHLAQEIESAPVFVESFPPDLVIQRNNTNPNHQVDVSIPSESVNVTLDVTADLDTGSEASNTWYYIWSFRDSTNALTFRLSASATAPTEPPNYTKERCLGAVRNDASSSFEELYQNGRIVTVKQKASFSGTPASSLSALDLSAYIPENAKKIGGWALVWNPSGGKELRISAKSHLDLGSTKILFNGTANGFTGHYQAPIAEAQTIYLSRGTTSGVMVDFYVTMFEY